MSRVAFINPNLVFQRDDPLTTGIVYMPTGLSYLVGQARREGYETQIIDAFGENPNQFWEEGRFVVRGLRPAEVADRIDDGVLAVCCYAINVTYHRALLELIRVIRCRLSGTPIVVIENAHAVTAYALSEVQDDLYDAGADFVVCGEAERRGVELLDQIKANGGRAGIAQIDGIGFRSGTRTVFSEPRPEYENLDTLAFPAWELFPLGNYWKLRYAHGPLSAKKYLPLLTSRGCPYPCRFCVIPKTNNRSWRARSPESVVDEIEYWQKKLGISEFHIEDVDPTVREARTRGFCEEIIRRRVRVTWKICAGTKVETIKSVNTIDLMARAGCTYISISPESGSKRVMRLIAKPFDYDHAIKLVDRMSRCGIRSQACFVLGFPGEEDEDRLQTRAMVRDLARAGVDEIAQFVITPIPGSAIFSQFSGYTDLSELHFSPTWRTDYGKINRFRVRLYRDFLFWKLRFHPLRILRQPVNFLLRRFETKMEMTPYRALHTLLMLKGLAGVRWKERPESERLADLEESAVETRPLG